MFQFVIISLIISIICTSCEAKICGTVDCVNGECINNICSCQQCYTGPSCQLIKNKAPIFDKSTFTANLNEEKGDNVIIKVTAQDVDQCNNVTKCGCGEIVYSILDDWAKNEFEIDSNLGEIRQKPGISSLQEIQSFTVKATNKNPFDNIYDTANIIINAKSSSETVLKRFRRAVAPSTLAFNLVQVFPTTVLTNISIGQRMTFTVTISFPVGSSAMTLELFAPETTTNSVMMICGTSVVSVGSNLTNSSAILITTQEGTNGAVWPYTHIVFTFPTMTNNQSSPDNITTIQVVISFDVVMLFSPTTVSGTTYYVSAGSEYLNGQQIWVGQAGYIANLITPTPAPVITLTGDTTIWPGRTASFNLSIQAPDAYLYLNLAIYTPLNNTAALSLCIVKRYYVGASYSCLPVTYNQPNLTSIMINNQLYYPSATMNLGVLGNMYYMEPSHTDINEKTILISITARINPNLWTGGYYYIGASITNTLTTIYSGAAQVLAIAPPGLTPYTPQITNSLNYHRNVTQISIGSPGRILMLITVPTGTELDYNITATSTSNTVEICGVTFLSAGLNIPCVDQINFTTTYVMSSDNYAIQATTVISGVRHVKISSNASDDILQIIIAFKPINDSRNVVGNTINTSAVLGWTGGISPSSVISFVLIAPAASNSSLLPNFTFAMKGNDGNVSVASSYQLYFGMRLQPGAVYTPATLEFYMPFNNTIRIGMCSIALSYVGKNVLCFNPAFITPKMVFSSKINDSLNPDKLQIPIGVLCTSGYSAQTATINDEIQITINLLVLTHPMNIPSATTNLNAGMMLSPVQIWVGNQPITIISQATLATLSGGNTPTIIGQRIDSTNYIVWLNDLAIIQYVIKTAPGTITSLNLVVSSTISTANSFGVCQMNIIKQGSSIPCINGTMTNTTWSTYSKYCKTGILTFTNILNTGTVALVNTAAFDDNSILVEVTVKFGSSLPTSFNVVGTLNFNGGSIVSTLPFTFQSSLSRFNGTVTGTEPIFNIYLAPLFTNSTPNINNIAYSETVRCVASVQILPAVFLSLKMIFSSQSSTMSQMDILSVNILYVGRNIPCLQTGMISYAYLYRTGSVSNDLTSLDLGTVCQRSYLPNTTSEDNKIFLEAVFRVWKWPLGNPTSIQINAIGLNNNDQVYVTTITVNSSTTNNYINDTNLLGQNLTLTATVSLTTVPIGSLFKINVTLGIPPYCQFRSGVILVSSANPAGTDSFLFVSGNVNFTGSFGKNIGINSIEPLPMTLKSSFNNSQNDYFFADFGVVQNTATTYRMGQNNYTTPNADDSINIVITVKLTDNSVTTNGYVINFNVNALFGSQNTSFPLQITVSRTNTETLSINQTTTLISTNTIYTSSDTISASVQAIMSNLSTLECRNFTIYIACPSYIQLSGITNQSYSSSGYSIVVINSVLGGFSFNVPYFFYTENITIFFNMSVAAGLNLTRNRVESILTVPVVYACKTLNWPLNPMGNKWFNVIDTFLFNVKGVDKNISGCNNNLMVTDNTVIKDCAISAYMSPFTGFDALKIRSNSGSYWIPHIRSGQYNKLRYIDIRFGTLTTVTKIIVTSTIANKPQIIAVYGTMDGRSYAFYQNMTLSYGGNIAMPNLVNPPFTYRGIRIAILNASQDDQMTGMNIDLYGCSPAGVTDTRTFDPCAVTSFFQPTVPLQDFYYRGYLYVSPYLFLCDEIASLTKGLETFPRCFRSNVVSGVTTWEDLGNQVGKIVGFDIGNLTIYAIASDLSSYIVSEDNGLTWTGLNGMGWQITKTVANLQAPTVIPWINDTTFDYLTTGVNCTKYSAGSISFCYDGLYSGSLRLFTWNNCCS